MGSKLSLDPLSASSGLGTVITENGAAKSVHISNTQRNEASCQVGISLISQIDGIVSDFPRRQDKRKSSTDRGRQ